MPNMPWRQAMTLFMAEASGNVFLPSLPATFSIHSHLPWRAIYSKQATLEANKWLRRSLSCSESGEIAQRCPWLSGCTCIKATAGSGLSSHHEINQIKLSFSRHQHIQCMHESVCFQCLQIHSLCFHPFLFSFSLWLWHLALKVATMGFSSEGWVQKSEKEQRHYLTWQTPVACKNPWNNRLDVQGYSFIKFILWCDREP